MTWHKPFDQDLFEEHKDIELIVHDLIKISHHSLIKNPVKYHIDLVITHPKRGVVGFLEVEHWDQWKTGNYYHGSEWSEDYPFPTFHIFDRKEKFFQNNAFLVGVSKMGKNMILLPLDERVRECKKETRQLRYGQEPETYYVLPRKMQLAQGTSNICTYLERYFNERN